MTGRPVSAASARANVLFPDPASPVTTTRRPIAIRDSPTSSVSLANRPPAPRISPSFQTCHPSGPTGTVVEMKVRFAVAPGGVAFDGARFIDLVEQLEARGFDTLWLSDIPMGPSIDPVVGLGYAAAASKRLKLGANVVPFGRNPMILAKTLAQLDRLSDGRLLLSLVPGLDQPNERLALGIGTRNRWRLIEDIIPLLRAWWAGEPVSHQLEGF